LSVGLAAARPSPMRCPRKQQSRLVLSVSGLARSVLSRATGGAMFRPETPSEEIEQHVEAVMTELVEELDHWVQQDHVPDGADDRAYVQAFSDVRDNSNRDQVALLHAAVARPHLAES